MARGFIPWLQAAKAELAHRAYSAIDGGFGDEIERLRLEEERREAAEVASAEARRQVAIERYVRRAAYTMVNAALAHATRAWVRHTTERRY